MARGQNIISKVFNKPLLITLTDLQPITDYLSDPSRVASLRLSDDEEDDDGYYKDVSIGDIRSKQLKKLGINPETMTGQLNIDGVLVNRKGQMNAQCAELTSYQKLKEQFEAQVAEGITSCVLMVSSGGGEAYASFSTAMYVKKIARQNNIKLTTYINGSACSAAYVWAVIADEIVSHPQGQAGSIGVVVQLYNDSGALEQAGIKRSFVYAGGNKIPFDSDGEFTDKFLADLQKSVDKTYSKFVDHVAANRSLSRQEIIDTNASVFDADDALSLRLIDSIMELEDFEVEYGLKTKTGTTGKADYHRENPPVEQELSLNNNHKETLKMTDKSVEQVLEAVVEQVVEQASNVDVAQDAQLAVLQEQLTTLNAELLSNKEALVKLASEKGEIETLLSSAQEQVKQLTSQLDSIKLAQVESDRKAKLENVLGTENDQVATLLSTTMALDDVAFGAIVSALEAKVEKEDKELNAEVGNSANQDTTPPDYNAALKAQFSKK